MSETITLFEIKRPEKHFGGDRGDFKESYLSAFEKKEKLQTGYASVSLFLFNSQGQLLIQKRSEKLTTNPGLWDESVRGHLTFGLSPEEVIAKEAMEEVGIQFELVPKEVIQIFEDRAQGYLLGEAICNVCKTYKGVEGIRVMNKNYVFVGLYDGLVNPLDGEVSETRWLDLEILHSEIQSNPSVFSDNLKQLFEYFERDLSNFIKNPC